MNFVFNVPYLCDDVIENKAEEFLSKHHPERVLPIPIEEIIELKLQLEILLLANMRK